MDLVRLLDTARTFLRSEFENVRRYEVSWRKRFWLYRHGFLSSKDAIWDLSDETVNRYLSDREYRRLGRIDGAYHAALENKLLFHMLLSPTDESMLPTVHGLVRDGRFVDIDRFECVGTFDELEARAKEHPLILKPVTAAKGDGVRRLDWKDGALRIDREPLSRRDFRTALASDRDLLLTDNVTQATYASRIYPHATNTLRVLTMVDPRTGAPFVASAVHRFGTAESGHVDNWSRGGVSARIDLETGELGRTVSRARTVTWMDSHPDTGADIAGTAIPAWDRVTDAILDLADRYAGLWPHVGWDVVLTDDEGSMKILEGEPQSVDADQQAHRPLLTDERTRHFYAKHGVLVESRSAHR